MVTTASFAIDAVRTSPHPTVLTETLSVVFMTILSELSIHAEFRHVQPQAGVDHAVELRLQVVVLVA